MIAIRAGSVTILMKIFLKVISNVDGPVPINFSHSTKNEHFDRIIQAVAYIFSSKTGKALKVTQLDMTLVAGGHHPECLPYSTALSGSSSPSRQIQGCFDGDLYNE